MAIHFLLAASPCVKQQTEQVPHLLFSAKQVFASWSQILTLLVKY